MTYIIFYIFVIILLQKEAKSPLPNMYIRRFVAVAYTLFVGLRGANVGQDTAVYYQHYYTFGQWGCNFVERGFNMINMFCYHQGWESWTLFLTCAILTVLPVYLMMNKLPRKEFTIVATLFYCCSFTVLANGMRQAVVCGVFLYMMSYYFKKTTYHFKDLTIYITGIAVSSWMHESILLLLPILLFNKVPANQRIYVVLYMLSFLFLFIDVSSYLPTISVGNLDYSRYVENVHVRRASGLGFLATTTQKVLILICMCKYNAFKKYRMLSHFVMFFLILGNLGYSLPIVSRISVYFLWFVYVMIAKLYVEQDSLGRIKPYTLNIWMMIFACYVILHVHGIFSTSNHLLPYTTYWQENNYMNYIWVEK